VRGVMPTYVFVAVMVCFGGVRSMFQVLFGPVCTIRGLLVSLGRAFLECYSTRCGELKEYAIR